jgi:hypothetical protein
MPDLGNPYMLAGLCWWQDYGRLLDTVGLLHTVRKAKCIEHMSFGDGPGQSPLFVLLQVPLWHLCTDSSTIVVFTNIRIVPNTVGLLDGKNNMAALGLSCQLGNDEDTRFMCQNKILTHIDEGSHFFLCLACPRRFSNCWPGPGPS